MREFLGGIEGASSHASDWLDPIIAALASEGAHNVHDLAGAKFEDFDFSASSMNGAAKRLVRQAIALATAGQAPPPPSADPQALTALARCEKNLGFHGSLFGIRLT